MGNRIGKLFGSTSRSQDIEQIPKKVNDDVKPKPTVQAPRTNLPTESKKISETIPAVNTATTVSTTSTIVAPVANDDQDLPQFLLTLLSDIAKKEGFTNYTLNVTKGSNHGDGFLAVLKRVTLSGVRNGADDKLTLICKLMPSSKARREQFNSDAVFVREAFMYSQVLPVFADFQREKGVKLEDGFHQYPKCYGTMDDKENDHFVIVMEDLKESGYLMFDKLKPANVDHVRLFVESLGRLHAVSYALKDQRPEVFSKFTHLKDVFVSQMADKPEIMTPMFHFFFDKAIAAFKPEDVAEINALNKMKENVMDELMQAGSGEAGEPFSIINHGDCWNNNLMYSYDKEGKVPQSICLIDYQISRYSSPILDLVYFFFSSTDKALRDQHYPELIQLYHKSLTDHLNKLGSDASKLFSFDDLQTQFKKFGRYALVIAPMLLNIITAKPDDLPDLDNLAEEMVNNEKTLEEGMQAFSGNDSSLEMFNERVRDVVRDVLRLGYF